MVGLHGRLGEIEVDLRKTVILVTGTLDSHLHTAVRVEEFSLIIACTCVCSNFFSNYFTSHQWFRLILN